MDILYWNKLSADIKHEDTTKQFFGKYLWRLVVLAPGARILLAKFSTIEQAMEHRALIRQNYSWASSWRKHNSIDDINIDLLKDLQTVKTKYGSIIRTRIEEPWMQIYSEDEATLKLIAEEFDPAFRANFISVSGPADSEAEELLRSGAIIRCKDIEFDYKVILKDGRYNKETKQRMLQYLDGLGNDVKLSKGCREMLLKTYPSMWNVFFYTKDPKIVTFLNLINPGIVSNIHKLVHLDYK